MGTIQVRLLNASVSCVFERRPDVAAPSSRRRIAIRDAIAAPHFSSLTKPQGVT
jgi:hypothetical protein